MDLIISKATIDFEWWHLCLYLIYFFVSFVMFFAFFKVYIKFTPYDEIALIRSGNLAVSVAFSGALIGFAINLGFAMFSAHNIVQYLLFGLISAIIQLLCYKIVDIFFKGFSEEIKTFSNMPVAILYASLSICIGIINGVSGF